MGKLVATESKLVATESKRRLLLPLSIVFFAFGIEICDYFATCRFPRLMRLWRILITLALHFSMGPILLFTYFQLVHRMNINERGSVAVYLAYIPLVAITLLTYEFYLIKQKEIRQFLKTLYDLSYPSLLKRRLLVHVAVVASCFLPFLITPYGILSGKTNLNMKGNETHGLVYFLTRDIFWHYVWLGTFRPFLLFSTAFYLCICFLFKASFRDLEDTVLVMSVPKFLQRHQVLCSQVKKAETLFTSLVFVACTSDVITTLFFLRSANLSGDVATWKIYLLPYVVLNFGLFTARLMAAAAVNSRVTTSLKGIDIMVNPLLDSSSVNSFMTLTKLTCYTQRLSINPPSLTGGGFFTMKRGCILAVGNAILTYILVLYQSM